MANNQITIFVNDTEEKYFFSTSHTQRSESIIPLNSNWIPISWLSRDKNDIELIYLAGYEQINNPDPKFQA